MITASKICRKTVPGAALKLILHVLSGLLLSTNLSAGPEGDGPADPRPYVLLLGGGSMHAWDSGLGWADLLVEERLQYNINVVSPSEWHIWDFHENLDKILAAHPDARTILIAGDALEASSRSLAQRKVEDMWVMMKDIIKKIRVARPEAKPVIVTPLPVVNRRLKDDGRRLFGGEAEMNCRTLSDAYAYAGEETKTPVINLYEYVWKMNRHPFKPNEKPGAPGFVMGSRGYEIRDWGPPMIVPWIAEQLDAVRPASADPEAYKKWLGRWEAQRKADTAVKGIVSHGPAMLEIADGRVIVPPEFLGGPTLDVLVKAKKGRADIQPCISNRHPGLALKAPLLTVGTDQGTVTIRVQPGHWQILKEQTPNKAYEVYELAATEKFKQLYFARAQAGEGKRMWILLRFLLGELRGKEIKSAGMKLQPRGRRIAVTVHPVLGADVDWHPNKATWNTRDGVVPWNGGPDGAPVKAVAAISPRPSHGARPRIALAGEEADLVTEVISRKDAIAADLARIRKLLESHGGSWEKWNGALGDFRNEVRANSSGQWPWPAKNDFIFQGAAVNVLLRNEVDTELDGKGGLDLLVSLNRQLRAMGIDLILVPIPDKIAVYPDYFAGETPGDRRVNVAAMRLIHDLLVNDVEVVDLYSLFADYRKETKDSVPLYYVRDSHWLNAAARMAAKAIAPRLNRYESVKKAIGKDRRYSVKKVMRSDEKADTVSQVWQSGGRPYAADRASPIALTGDSFSMMNSHMHSGLDAQIASYINMPIDRIWRAGFGPKDAMLTFARSPKVLEGRKVAVVTFIARGLGGHDKWRIVQFKKLDEQKVPAVKERRVTGIVMEHSERPREDSEYKDFFMQFLVAGIIGKDGKPVAGGKAVVNILAMKDKKFLPIAKANVADKLELLLTSWAEVDPSYNEVETGTLEDVSAVVTLPMYYGMVPGQTAKPGKSFR